MNVNKNELAEISATCERYIGTEGGGMDQAIAYFATKGNITRDFVFSFNRCYWSMV